MVITDPFDGNEYVVVNDPAKLKEIYEENKTNIWVGFNSNNYDRYIMSAILCDFDPYDVSKWIIDLKKPGFTYSRLFKKIQFITFDCMVGYHGLKSLEAFMGESIHESSVDFTIDRKLTTLEISETIEYCRADVYNTMKVFAARKGEFNGYLALIKLFKLPLHCLGMTKAQLVALILDAQKTVHNDEFDIQFPPTLQVNKYTEVLDFYTKNWDYDKGNFWIKVCDVWHSFGTGGVHGAEGTVLRTNRKGETVIDKRRSYPIVVKGNILHIDVASYYPSLNIEYPELTLSRNVPDPTKVRKMRDERLQFKAEGKADEAYGLKIAINAIGGATKLKSSKLYDPRQNNNMCIGGQVLLLDLLEKLEGHIRLLQSNTDGIILQYTDRENVVNICREWEARTGMALEYHDCDKLYQGDVNNYVLVFSNGKVEAKGAYVKDLNPLDYNLAIVNKAVRAALIDGTPIEQTVWSSNNLMDFMMVVKLASDFTQVIHNGKPLHGKYFRVFASLDGNDGEIGRVREMGDNPEKFANTPTSCFVENGKIVDSAIPTKLDRQWYIDEARKRLKEKFGVEM